MLEASLGSFQLSRIHRRPHLATFLPTAILRHALTAGEHPVGRRRISERYNAQSKIHCQLGRQGPDSRRHPYE